MEIHSITDDAIHGATITHDVGHSVNKGDAQWEAIDIPLSQEPRSICDHRREPPCDNHRSVVATHDPPG